MSELYNIYCDESCHLENDHQEVMVLGAIWCPKEKTRKINTRLRDIKQKHGLSQNFEIKWTKVSPAKLDFYINIIDYFFDNEDIHFRALIIPDKSKLNHKIFNQTHDEWYYKMYFDLLKLILKPDSCYEIYIDIKDTRGASKVKKLHEVLCNNIYDFSRQIIDRIQLVRSNEIILLQITDLLTGAISHYNRHNRTSEAKLTLIEHIQRRSGYKLDRTTLYMEKKFNLFFWSPAEIKK